MPCEASLINVYQALRDPCKNEGIVIRTAAVRDEDGLLIIISAPCKGRTTVPWERGCAAQLKCKDRFLYGVMTRLSIGLVSGTLLGRSSPATGHGLSAVNG